MEFGYSRVSTVDQDTRSQIDAFKAHGISEVYEEKRSGRSMHDRPVLQAILAKMRAGDVLVVYKLDRLARSLRDLLAILDRLERSGVGFRSLTEFIDTSTPAGRLMMQMIGSFAEFEREMLHARTVAGIRAAQARGKHCGRPRTLPPLLENAAKAAVEAGESKRKVAADYGVSVTTLRRWLDRD